MRKIAITLFHLIKDLDEDIINKLHPWLLINVNTDLREYVYKLLPIYSNNKNYDNLCTCPPFVVNPKYYTNAETITKANLLVLMNETIYADYSTGNIISINTNYSGWNLMANGYLKNLNYFREDIGLNAFYLGLHYLHPFWMSNKELDELHPRHAEHYYYAHHQLLARYVLEVNTIKNDNTTQDLNNYDRYDPYLRYDNGLSFPVRYFDLTMNDKRWTYIKTMQILIKETLSRDFIILVNIDCLKC